MTKGRRTEMVTKGIGDLGKWSLREQSSAENVRLPRETEVNVTERRACHPKRRGAPGEQGDPCAPLNPAQCCKCNACHAKRRPMPPSATPAVQTETVSPPATQNEGRCHQAPRLPGETEVNVTDPRAPPACHEKKRSMSPSATPATQSATAACHAKRKSMPPSATLAKCCKCYVCHTKGKSMSPSATPAMQNESQYYYRVPRLPAQCRRRHPRLPGKTKVKVCDKVVCERAAGERLCVCA